MRKADPEKHSNKELLAWLASIVQREQQKGTFGVISVHMQGGKIVRVKTEQTEEPPKAA